MNATIPTVSPSDANASRSACLLLDVRTPAEFEEMHIEGAVLHPITELNPAKVTELMQGRSCIVVCKSGGRARKAAEALAAAGLQGVRILEGGMTAWKSCGLAAVEGKKTISLERQVRICAGALVFIGSCLAYFVSPFWIAVPAFIGAGLVFAGVTDSCGMGMVLARMPWNTRGASSSSTKSSCSMT